MNPQLKALEALQQIDAEILELNRTGEGNPKRLAELEQDLAQTKGLWEQEAAKVAENEQQRHDLDEQIQAEKETLRKWETRLTEQRTPREYSALSREIDIGRKSLETLDHQKTELREAAIPLEQAAAERQQVWRERQKTAGAEATEIRRKMAALEEKLADLSARRAKAAAICESALLGRYDTIRRKRGIALVPVIGGSCRGCHISLPPQLYNQLRSGTATIHSCPSCHRLIYVPDPPPETNGT